MNIVADTNVVISGLLWQGAPRQLLILARQRDIFLFTSLTLLAEIEVVLKREKFFNRLEIAHINPQELVSGYTALAELVIPKSILPIVIEDPDDDEVIACAEAAKANYIVSGDKHLLNLATYKGIPILRPNEFINLIEAHGGFPLK